jgi:ABC-2 type transport system ATP-binding protein
MLELRNIEKNFKEVKALSGVSFKITNNSVIGLLGPNGAGKTTLMRIIVGFLTANQGKMLWDKKVVDSKSKKHKMRIGYLPENNPLYADMTTFEYLSFIAELKGVDDKVDKIKEIVLKCGLKEVINKKTGVLSKGFRQRVGLAAALLGDPKLLVLDEPTSGLDPNQIIEIRKLIKSLARNKIVLLSTHILPEAREICERILIINRGKIVLDEETKAIKNLEKKFVELTV